MAETVSARLERRHVRAIEAMTDRGDADNQSEALRTALDAGFQELGYRNGTATDGGYVTARAWAKQFATAFALLGVLWLVVATVPVSPLAIVTASFASSLGCLALARILRGEFGRGAV